MKRSYSLTIRRNSGPAAVVTSKEYQQKSKNQNKLSLLPGKAAVKRTVVTLKTELELVMTPCQGHQSLVMPSGPSHQFLAGSGAKEASSGKTINIAVLGANQVGKTALVVRFLTRRFIWEYSCEERTYIKRADQTFTKDSEKSASAEQSEDCVWLVIKDCQGLTKEKLTNPFPRADGYLLVFSVTDPDSFDLLSEAMIRVPIAAPCLIVAAKSDLDHLRVVPRSKVEELAEQWNVSHCQCSAREDPDSVTSVFIKLFKDITGRYLSGSASNSEGDQSSPSNRKRKPSQRIVDSFNKMLIQMSRQK